MDLAIYLDRASGIAIYQQLAEEIRGAVLAGRLKPNCKLPSSRALAKSLQISRSTVTQSYEQLESEGYLETRCGSGTYVCSQIPDEWLQSQPIQPVVAQSSQLATLSQFGNTLASVKQLAIPEPENEISFRYGNPAVEHFPIKQWRRLLDRYCENSPDVLNYVSDTAGHLPLRVEIAKYLGRSRGVACTPEQIIIVSGSQQALNLIACLMLDRGDWVAMEDPGYLGARHCFTAQGARLKAIAVNSEGLDLETLARCQQKFKLIYVTPSHQFPTGVTLPITQRLALLQWAQKTGTLIIEDDYDSEYRYREKPIPALQGLDRSQSVVYVGTFSKILFPSLRIGYLVVPPAWISIFSKAKWLGDRFSPLLEQYALTDWIAEGHFERHIRRMRHLYDSRRQVLVKALKSYFGSRVTILGENAGIHLMAKIETNLTDEMVIKQAATVGVGLISARGYYLEPKHQGEFIFGYAQIDEAQIEQGIHRLYQVLVNNF